MNKLTVITGARDPGKNVRPAFVPPSYLAAALRSDLIAKAKREWVWVNGEGFPFWTTEARAKKSQAANGGHVFPPASEIANATA